MKYSELLARQKEINSLRDLIYTTIITHRKYCESGIVFPPNTLKSLHHTLEIVDDMVRKESFFHLTHLIHYSMH